MVVVITILFLCHRVRGRGRCYSGADGLTWGQPVAQATDFGPWESGNRESIAWYIQRELPVGGDRRDAKPCYDCRRGAGLMLPDCRYSILGTVNPIISDPRFCSDEKRDKHYRRSDLWWLLHPAHCSLQRLLPRRPQDIDMILGSTVGENCVRAGLSRVLPNLPEFFIVGGGFPSAAVPGSSRSADEPETLVVSGTESSVGATPGNSLL